MVQEESAIVIEGAKNSKVFQNVDNLNFESADATDNRRRLVRSNNNHARPYVESSSNNVISRDLLLKINGPVDKLFVI